MMEDPTPRGFWIHLIFILAIVGLLVAVVFGWMHSSNESAAFYSKAPVVCIFKTEHRQDGFFRSNTYSVTWENAKGERRVVYMSARAFDAVQVGDVKEVR